jgi:dihydroorotase/N-acyl-D-amino-acid deacylase
MSPFACHSERSEESSSATACGHPAGFFADAPNDRAAGRIFAGSVTRRATWALALFLAFARLPAAEPAYDLILINGLVYDGTGGPALRADVAITGATIAKVGDLANVSAKRRIDVRGLAVAPGFIDLHAHIEPLRELPDGQSALRQGVTTALGGPDGGGPWPFAEYLAGIEKLPLGPNVAYLAGFNSIRRSVMKLVNRAPTADELREMERCVEQSMRAGAFGISTGLKYVPGAFATTDEVIALSRVAARHGGIYTSHLREEGLALIPAVEEAIEIGRAADLPVVLTHHKVVGKPSWGASVKTLALVDAARTRGQDVMIDQYPYTASYTGISVLIPSWALEGGVPAFKERTDKSDERARIKAGIVEAILTDRGAGDIARVQFSRVAWKKDLEGRTLRDWCIERGLEPTPEHGADLVIEAHRNGGAGCVFHAMDDADVERIMRHPQTMIASDGTLSRPGDGHPHPRCYGTFPRVLGLYVREKQVLTLANAIHKMTLMPAQRLALKDRGRIAAGMDRGHRGVQPRHRARQGDVHRTASIPRRHSLRAGQRRGGGRRRPVHLGTRRESAARSGISEVTTHPMLHAKLLGRFLLAAALLVVDLAAAAVFPGKSWQVAARTEDHGFSADKLGLAREYAGTIKTSAFMLVHGGVVVTQWGDVDRKFNTHSIRKSFLATLYGAPVREGKIKLDVTLAELGLDDTPPLTDEEKKATVRDCLKARSGIYHPALYESAGMKKLKPERHTQRPGTHWYYNNYDFNIAGTIYEKLTGRKIFEAIQEDIAAPIGMEDYSPADGQYVRGEESIHAAYPFRVTARDLARFGLLMLRGGEWNGRQLIDRAWIAESTRYHSDATLYSTDGYGYMWWVARDHNKFSHLPGVKIPEGSFSARGSGGHHVLVIPAYDLVIVHRVNTDIRGTEVTSREFGQLVRLVLEARMTTSERAATQ